jgi:hypothetical protein
MGAKLDLAIVVAVACGVLSVEYGNNIVMDVPADTDRSALAAAAECPDNDSMPYPPSCLIFMQGKPASDVGRRPAAEKSMVAHLAAVKQELSLSPGPECPANDTMPYGTRCIAFLTGWFWQPNSAGSAAPAVRSW